MTNELDVLLNSLLCYAPVLFCSFFLMAVCDTVFFSFFSFFSARPRRSCQDKLAHNFYFPISRILFFLLAEV